MIFSPLRNTHGNIEGIIGVVQEITARTSAVQRMRAANRLYTISSRVSAVAASVHDLEALLASTCRIATEEDAVCMAWIGLFDRAAGILWPVAHTGNGEDLPKEGYHVAGRDREEGLAGEAIRTGGSVVCRCTETGPAAQPWIQDAFRHGYRSLAAVPFRLNGEVVGAVTLCSGEPDAFSEAESEQLLLLGTTLSSALDLLDKKTLQRRAGRDTHGELGTHPVPRRRDRVCRCPVCCGFSRWKHRGGKRSTLRPAGFHRGRAARAPLNQPSRYA